MRAVKAFIKNPEKSTLFKAPCIYAAVESTRVELRIEYVRFALAGYLSFPYFMSVKLLYQANVL